MLAPLFLAAALSAGTPLAGGALATLTALILWALCGVALKLAAEARAENARLSQQLFQTQKISAIGEISTGIAHEINNPLNIILQEAELARVDLADKMASELGSGVAREVDESLDVIIQQVRRCSDITHKLLDLARKRQPVTQDADVNRLVLDMLNLVERDIGVRDVRIHRDFGEDIPTVLTDPPLLRQVLLNLLNNAMQAVGERGEIRISTRYEDGLACVRVGDSGPGIPKGDEERVFHPFYTTKAPGEGTGLGLSVSLRIMEQLGGTIEASSPPGGGAVFTVRIPVHPMLAPRGD
jgi:signal transduction histidine kinase